MSTTSSILSSGVLGNIYSNQLAEQKQLVMSKWDNTGLLEGLSGAMRENIAVLFENQAQHMLSESTTSASSGSFETVAFPVIRRVFSKLLANDIVSIQALNLPVGRIYFIDPKISLRKADGSHYTMDGVYSNAAGLAASAKTQFSTTSLYDSYYPTESDPTSGLFDRSKGKATVNTASVTLATTWVNGTTQKLVGSISGFSTTNRGKLVGPSGIPADTEEFLASLKITANTVFANSTASYDTLPQGTPLTWRTLAQKYATAIVNAAGNIAIEIDLSASDAIGSYNTIAYSSLTVSSSVTFTAVYNTYSSLEEDAEIAEVSFDFSYVTVDVPGARALRATFTPQIQQDISAFHSIDVEAELTALLSETVAMEIDREVLRDLRNGAAWLAKWDYKGYEKRIASGSVALTRKDYNQELLTIVNQISARIQQTTLRGGATWIVVSPAIGAVLNDLEYFHVTNADAEETKYSLGIEKIGSLQNRYTVYVDTYAQNNSLLIGHKGDTIFHTGYCYCPYVPLMFFPKVVNPADFKTVLGVMTRYATKMINNRFYGKIQVDGLPSIGTIAEFL